GCSKENEPVLKTPKTYGRSFIPPSTAELLSSPDFKLEHTTKSGAQLFVCPISPELAKSFTIDSPEHRFLFDGTKPCLVIPVREDKIVELNSDESVEAAEFVSKRGTK
ncbi:MAG: hypothetical protein ABJC04_11960, partial [Verrucomicrobiota bacterium]